MNFSQLSTEIVEKCPEVLKAAWEPVATSEGSTTGNVTKFGGAEPFRSEQFRWPKCVECGKQKTFICQINIAKLPTKVKLNIKRSDGLFQCFFCLDCMPFDGCFDDIYFLPESELIPNLQSLASKCVFQSDENTQKLPDALRSFVLTHNEVYRRSDWEGFEEKQVESWVELKQEIPSCEEITGSDGGEHIILTRTDITEDELIDLEDNEEESPLGFPNSGIKIGGYVKWCQGVEYPTCPDCKVKMTIMFLQMERDVLFPFNWGDSGTAHVTLCPDCGRPGLGWACC